MEWKKSPPELIAAFDGASPKDAKAVRRPMFGYPALFVNGNMFAGTYQDKIVVRLAEADRAILLKEKGAKTFEPMAGRPMKEYVVVPAAIVAKRASLRTWIAKGLAYAEALPPKKKR